MRGLDPAGRLTPAFGAFGGGSGSGNGVLRVRVLRSDGSPAKGVTVTSVGANGPFLADGKTLAMAQTDSKGWARIEGLALGTYCVHARPLTLAAATQPLVPPPSGFSVPASDVTQGAVVTGPNGHDLPLTRENYLANCVTARPLPLTKEHPVRDVTLKFGKAAGLDIMLVDLTGAPAGATAWMVVGFGRDEIPWFDQSLPPDIHPALLHSASPGAKALLGLPAGEGWGIEALREIGSQGLLTLTLRGTAEGPGAVTQLGTQDLEPLVCAVNKRPERAGDSKKVDFLGPIKDGFRARPDLTVQPDQLAIWWEQTGNGQASIELRIKMPKGQLRLVADYRCENGNCVHEATSGTATREGAGVQLFFSPLGGSRVKVTAAIHGIPAGFTEVSYYLKTPQDNVPDPDRSDADRAFIAVPLPSVCTAGQSNDDRWVILL